MTGRCETCRHFRPGDYIGGPERKGVCDWTPPPFVARLVAMLQAEPATQIDWIKASAAELTTTSHESCGAWSPATLAGGR